MITWLLCCSKPSRHRPGVFVLSQMFVSLFPGWNCHCCYDAVQKALIRPLPLLITLQRKWLTQAQNLHQATKHCQASIHSTVNIYWMNISARSVFILQDSLSRWFSRTFISVASVCSEGTGVGGSCNSSAESSVFPSVLSDRDASFQVSIFGVLIAGVPFNTETRKKRKLWPQKKKIIIRWSRHAAICSLFSFLGKGEDWTKLWGIKHLHWSIDVFYFADISAGGTICYLQHRQTSHQRSGIAKRWDWTVNEDPMCSNPTN